MNTNDLRYELILFVLKDLITDNYITICCGKKFKNCLKTLKKSFFIRSKSNLGNEKFTSDLEFNLFNYFEDLPILTIKNYNDTFKKFKSVVQATIDRHIPLKKSISKTRKTKKNHEEPNKY